MNLSEFISFPRCHYVQRMYEQRLSDNLLEWILHPPRHFVLKRSLHCVMLQWFWANQDGTVEYIYKMLTCSLLYSSLCTISFHIALHFVLYFVRICSFLWLCLVKTRFQMTLSTLCSLPYGRARNTVGKTRIDTYF